MKEPVNIILTKRDFFFFSLSITFGLFFFVLIVFLLFKISTLSIFQKKEEEKENIVEESLDEIDDFIEEEEISTKV